MICRNAISGVQTQDREKEEGTWGKQFTSFLLLARLDYGEKKKCFKEVNCPKNVTSCSRSINSWDVPKPGEINPIALTCNLFTSVVGCLIVCALLSKWI